VTPEEWRRIREVLESALELPPEQRSRYLDESCADANLRNEIESLIASHDQAGTQLLNNPPVLLIENEARFRLPPGKRVGIYEIVEEIAQGGMGAVYRATRADGEYKQDVAIKIVRAELGATLTDARFRNERQILASLDHPNIAKILDGGTTGEGLPYFVMEYIDGLPITDFCNRQKLSIDARLKIFRDVCSAVHYAHQRLVIHRDIKPSNILVTTDGVPKLLDFGIAKVLDRELLPQNAAITAAGILLMTPEYASPEQLRGELPTTATDVYSLGLVLYELLAGHHAYKFSGLMPYVIARVVLETDPEKPSTAIWRAGDATSSTSPSDNNRAGDAPEKLRGKLSGDLDNIVMMAIRKEPGARYSSADQLSEDIRRHQTGLPIVARKSTFGYRCRKYVQRHKLGVAAAALIFISLITGITMTIREARIARANELRAERRFNDVRALANSLMFEVHDSIKDLAGATPARKLLVSKALTYLDSLSQEAANDSTLQRELAAAYEKVGDVQGNPFAANLGDTAGALASYRKALAIRESLNTAEAHSDENLQALANDYERIGLGLETSGDFRGALEYYRKDFPIRALLAKTSPTPRSKDRLASAYFLIAHCYSRLQDPGSALENYRKSAEIRESLAADSPFVLSRLAGTYSFIAGLIRQQGDANQASLLQSKSLEISKKLAAADPANATNREFLDEAYFWQGFYLHRAGNLARALENYRRALSDFRALSATDPKEVRIKHYVATCQKNIGAIMVENGDIAQGLQDVQEAILIFESLQGPENTEYLADAYDSVGAAYSRLANRPGLPVSARLENWKHARAAYQKSSDALLGLKQSGVLTEFGSSEPDHINKELAKCEAAIAELTASAGNKEKAN
jgi:eukaryotic-like serine/threonine-protein kinase